MRDIFEPQLRLVRWFDEENGDEGWFDAELFARNDGDLAATDNPDTAAILLSLVNTATLAAKDETDEAAISLTAVAENELAAVDEPDTASLSATAVSTGALGATDTPDTASISVSAIAENELAAVDAPDTAEFSATAINAGDLDATDNPDNATFIGAGAQNVIEGDLAATDNPDTASFIQNRRPVSIGVGQVFGSYVKPERPVVVLRMAATDEPDRLIFVGSTSKPIPRVHPSPILVPPKYELPPAPPRIIGVQRTAPQPHLLTFAANDEPDRASMAGEISSFSVQLDNEFILQFAE